MSDPPVALKGLEGVFGRMAMTIAHAFHCSLADSAALAAVADVHRCRRVWRRVAARHPKMRCFLKAHPQASHKHSHSHSSSSSSSSSSAPAAAHQGGQAKIIASLSDQHISSSVTVQAAVSGSNEEWHNIVRDRTLRIIDHSVEPPFSLLVLTPPPNTSQQDEVARQSGATGASDSPCTLRIFIFSAHFASDGFSGTRVLHDFLTFLCDDINNSSHEMTEASLAIVPSIFDRRFGLKYSNISTLKLSWGSWLWSKLMAGWIKLITPIIVMEFKKFRPLLPENPIQKGVFQYPYQHIIPTGSYFKTGKQENLEKLKRKCKAEKTTLHGAIVAASMIAFHRALVEKSNIFKLKVAIDYNERKNNRDKSGVLNGNETVGMNVSISNLEYYEKNGVNMKDTFWDHARHAKKQTDASHNSFASRLDDLVMHHAIVHSDIIWKKLPDLIPTALIGDLNISNIGTYAFPTTHDIKLSNSRSTTLKLNQFHVFNNNNPMAPSLLVFISTMESLNYSLSSRTPDDLAKTWLDHFFTVLEDAGNIEAHETLFDVSTRLIK